MRPPLAPLHLTVRYIIAFCPLPPSQTVFLVEFSSGLFTKQTLSLSPGAGSLVVSSAFTWPLPASPTPSFRWGASGPSSQGVQVVHIERLPRNPSPPHVGALAHTHFPRKSFRCGDAGNESSPQSGPCIPRLRTPVAGPSFFSPDSRISLLKGKKTGHEIVGKA